MISTRVEIAILVAFTRALNENGSGSQSALEMGSNFWGLRSRSSVYTASFFQDRDCDLDRDPVFLLRLNGVLVSYLLNSGRVAP